MSGTSLDGIDLCYISFVKDNSWSFNIIKSETIRYSEFWKIKLAQAINFTKQEIASLDEMYTEYLSIVIYDFITSHKIDNLDAVCSHGHTIFHQPEKGVTKQIGNLPILATLLNTTVVCDFRVQDVAFGGQGAPLVPIGDELLFQEYDACLNLGGFSNISFKKNQNRVAFDICPVNIVLNHYAANLGLEYDNAGQMAASGNINKKMLLKLNDLDFYGQIPPKSLGLEWVNSMIIPLIDSQKLSTQDILRTIVEHISIQISKVLNNHQIKSVLLSGGGAYNSFLIERIKLLTSAILYIPSKEIIDFKEALIFGLLGVLKLRNEVNCLASVTGAQQNHSTGNIFRN